MNREEQYKLQIRLRNSLPGAGIWQERDSVSRGSSLYVLVRHNGVHYEVRSEEQANDLIERTRKVEGE